jgi:hypothetical protein
VVVGLLASASCNFGYLQDVSRMNNEKSAGEWHEDESLSLLEHEAVSIGK